MKNKFLNLALLVILIAILPVSILATNASGSLYNSDLKEYHDKNEKQQVKYKFSDNSEEKLNYSLSSKDKLGSKEITQVTYKDTNDNEYTLDKNNKKLIRFKSNKNLKKLGKFGSVLNKSKVDQIANVALRKYTNHQKYTFISSSYNSEYKSYKYVWMRLINGIETNDVVYINISTSGDVLSVIIPFQEIYDNNQEELIRKSKLDKLSKSEAEDILRLYLKEKDFEEVDNVTNYRIVSKKIYFNENLELAWRFSILVDGIDNGSTSQIPIEIEIDALNKSIKELS